LLRTIRMDGAWTESAEIMVPRATPAGPLFVR